MTTEWLSYFLPAAPISAIVGFASGFALMLTAAIIMKVCYRDLRDPLSLVVKGACVSGAWVAVVFVSVSGVLAALPLVPLPVALLEPVLALLTTIADVSYGPAAIFGLLLGAGLLLVAFAVNFLGRK